MAQNLGDNPIVDDYWGDSGGISFELDGDLVEGTSNTQIANNSMTFINGLGLSSYAGINPRHITFSAPKIYLNSTNIRIRNNGSNSITFDNSSVNFDNAIYNATSQADRIGPINFTGSSSINVTSNTNGKTIIKASTLTGTVYLDVQSGVNAGDTFSIEATTNNLIITDGEWTATPSTVGNVTTYTLAKAGPSTKQRLFYTYENGNKVLRFLRSGL